MGKSFLIVSKLSGHALSGTDGAIAAVAARNEKDAHQIWYEDTSTGTLRNQANNQCLHLGGDGYIYLKPLEPGQDAQQWTFDKEVVRHRKDQQKVADLCRGSKDVGAQICAWQFHGGVNQTWEQVFVKSKFFFIKSELSGKVLDVTGANKAPGTKIVVWPKKTSGNDNQLWYEGDRGIIRSKLNDFVIDASQDVICLQPYDAGNPKRNWVFDGGVIAMQSNRDTVLDIVQASSEDGAQVCAWKKHGQPNQKWKLESAD